MPRDRDQIEERRALGRPSFCVCVPARDEEERLPRLLDALARQDIDGTIHVAICLNNSSDDSAGSVAAAQARHSNRLAIELDVQTFPSELAHAGSARAAAMSLGLHSLGREGGVLITTDADSRPPQDWIAGNLNAIAAGADIVGGRLILDEDESIPPGVAEGRALWDRYWAEVRKIEDEFDPIPWDSPPRHGDHTGASLALTSEIYCRSGGVPLLASGEDRALVEAAVTAGGRLVHPISVWTRVSPREDGRAAGGMAEMMREMRDFAAVGQPMMAPALHHWRERALWRRDARAAVCGTGRVIRAERQLPPMLHDAELAKIGLVS